MAGKSTLSKPPGQSVRDGRSSNRSRVDPCPGETKIPGSKGIELTAAHLDDSQCPEWVEQGGRWPKKEGAEYVDAFFAGMHACSLIDNQEWLMAVTFLDSSLY